MFDFLKFFRRHPEPDPPTDKQRRYAAKLGIAVPPGMTKRELSAAIHEAEKRVPAATGKRERTKRKSRERKHGKETGEQEEFWNRFSADVGYMLAVFTRGKETVVDVLLVNEAEVDDQGELWLVVEFPKLVKDRSLGAYLEWDQGSHDLPVSSLLHYEPLHPKFESDGVNAYRKAVEKGLKIARKL